MTTSALIDLRDAQRPAAPAGDYRVTASQHVDYGTGSQQFDPQPHLIRVAGPRWALDNDALVAQYPPSRSPGADAEALPSLVLSTAGLPWARAVDAEAAEDPATAPPFLALLLFEDGELIAPEPSGAPPDPTCVGLYGGTEIVSPPSGTLGPSGLTLTGDEASARVQAIEMSPDTWLAIAPSRAELPYLCHVRGDHAVVIGNRWPKPGARNVVHLVSLEGWGQQLPPAGGGPRPPADGADRAGPDWSAYQRVRVVSLASWVFTCGSAPGDFQALVTNLDRGLLRLPAAPPASWAEPSAEQRLALDALACGYVPLAYQTRLGEHTVAWYRGPLVPAPVAPAADLTPMVSPEQGMIYDPATGMFDLSYALAWQLGRLLGLADRSFAQAALTTHRANRRCALELHRRAAVMRRLDGIVAPPADPRELLGPHWLRPLARRYVIDRLGGRSQPIVDPAPASPGPASLSAGELAEILGGDDPSAAALRTALEALGV